MRGTVAYYNNNKNYIYIRVYDQKTKTHINHCVVSKYNKIDNFDIKSLPITTKHRIKQKIYGDVYYIMKCGDSYIYSSSPENTHHNTEFISRIKKDLGIKFLIDKHGNNSCIEIINDFNNDIYIGNIFSKDKIYD
jgi:hypothetical protein